MENQYKGKIDKIDYKSDGEINELDKTARVVANLKLEEMEKKMNTWKISKQEFDDYYKSVTELMMRQDSDINNLNDQFDAEKDKILLKTKDSIVTWWLSENFEQKVDSVDIKIISNWKDMTSEVIDKRIKDSIKDWYNQLLAKRADKTIIESYISKSIQIIENKNNEITDISTMLNSLSENQKNSIHSANTDIIDWKVEKVSDSKTSFKVIKSVLYLAIPNDGKDVDEDLSKNTVKANFLKWVVDELLAFPELIALIIENSEVREKVLSTLWDALKDPSKIFVWIWESLSDFESPYDAWKSSVNILLTATWLWSLLKNLWVNVIKKSIAPVMKTITKGKNWVIKIAEWTGKVAKETIEKGKNWVIKVAEWTGKVAKETIEKGKNWIKKGVEWAGKVAIEAKNKGKEWIIKVAGWIEEKAWKVKAKLETPNKTPNWSAEQWVKILNRKRKGKESAPDFIKKMEQWADTPKTNTINKPKDPANDSIKRMSEWTKLESLSNWKWRELLNKATKWEMLTKEELELLSSRRELITKDLWKNITDKQKVILEKELVLLDKAIRNANTWSTVAKDSASAISIELNKSVVDKTIREIYNSMVQKWKNIFSDIKLPENFLNIEKSEIINILKIWKSKWLSWYEAVKDILKNNIKITKELKTEIKKLKGEIEVAKKSNNKLLVEKLEKVKKLTEYDLFKNNLHKKAIIVLAWNWDLGIPKEENEKLQQEFLDIRETEKITQDKEDFLTDINYGDIENNPSTENKVNNQEKQEEVSRILYALDKTLDKKWCDVKPINWKVEISKWKHSTSFTINEKNIKKYLEWDNLQKLINKKIAQWEK